MKSVELTSHGLCLQLKPTPPCLWELRTPEEAAENWERVTSPSYDAYESKRSKEAEPAVTKVPAMNNWLYKSKPAAPADDKSAFTATSSRTS